MIHNGNFFDIHQPIRAKTKHHLLTPLFRGHPPSFILSIEESVSVSSRLGLYFPFFIIVTNCNSSLNILRQPNA